MIDQDAMLRAGAYNGLLQYAAEINAMGLGMMAHRKYQFGKLLVDGTMALMRSAMGILVNWRKSEMSREKSTVLVNWVRRMLGNQGHRDLREALKVLRRNSHQHVHGQKKLMEKKRGILKRFLDTEARLLGMGLAKLRDYNKWRKSLLEARIKSVAEFFRDKNSRLVSKGFNQFKKNNEAGMAKHRSIKEKICKRFSDKTLRDLLAALNK